MKACHFCLYIKQFHDVIGFINIIYENRISDFLFTHYRNDNWLIDYNWFFEREILF